MGTAQYLIRTTTTDRRVWGLTALFVGWPVLGAVVPVDFVIEPSIPMVYGYMLVLSTFTQSYPASVPFWIGFAVFCFGVSAVLVGLLDGVRAWYTSRNHRDREPTVRN